MPEERYVVELDREICMGAGVCVTYAGDTFAIGGDAKAEVTTPIVTSPSDIEVAASACPTGAITVVLHSEGTPAHDDR